MHVNSYSSVFTYLSVSIYNKQVVMMQTSAPLPAHALHHLVLLLVPTLSLTIFDHFDVQRVNSRVPSNVVFFNFLSIHMFFPHVKAILSHQFILSVPWFIRLHFSLVISLLFVFHLVPHCGVIHYC